MIPSPHDTIVAVSTGWDAAALGIVRLSGPRALSLWRAVRSNACARNRGEPPHHPPAPATGRTARHVDRVQVTPALSLPADVFCFHAPHSYTGQDVVEIHTVGALPALRALAARLIALGARRALPGEFTARAFLNGRMRAEQVEGVLRLIHAADQADARAAARLARKGHTQAASEVHDRLLDLLAAVEAGIDFADEEDVRFITTAELTTALDDLIARLARWSLEAAEPDRGGRPHVALAGLPNAGKSTLFNILLGKNRAIVSPVLGTTRDVLSGEIELDGVAIVLQDCAGLGTSTSELESAAHLAAEQAAAHADLVLWVHEHDRSWRAAEVTAARNTPAERRILVLSKIDRPCRRREAEPPLEFREVVRVSAARGKGLSRLQEAILRALSGPHGSSFVIGPNDVIAPALAALERARRLVREDQADRRAPELVALELRDAADHLGTLTPAAVVEDVLSRIMTRFCIGK